MDGLRDQVTRHHLLLAPVHKAVQPPNSIHPEAGTMGSRSGNGAIHVVYTV
jgi:hypothetical protein